MPFFEEYVDGESAQAPSTDAPPAVAVPAPHDGSPVLVQRTPVFGGAIHLEEGDTLRLECLVDGAPTPTIVWYKVGGEKEASLPRNPRRSPFFPLKEAL